MVLPLISSCLVAFGVGAPSKLVFKVAEMADATVVHGSDLSPR
jgi:hypothetical protein